MSTKPTPGPWLISSEDRAFVYALGDEGTNSFWAHVLTAGPERVSREECAANARLIASAPDLLEALQAVVAAWDALHSSTTYVEGIGDRQEDLEFREMQAARAAILKATTGEAA